MIITVTPNPVLDRTLTVPRIEFNGMIRATASRLDWGGKGFNVSRALLALGVNSVAMGFVGGTSGHQLERGLHKLAITTDLTRIDGETRTNIVITEVDAKQYIKVNEAGPTVRMEEVDALLDRVRERVRPKDIWVLSGSLPPGVPADFYRRLVSTIQANDARALLDSSGEALRMGCTAAPYLVKPNEVEAAEMTGREVKSKTDALEVVDFFLDRGVAHVALSLGADGLLLASEREWVWARPPRVSAQNPVGAGDALLAGIAWAMKHELPMEEMARWGVATGTAATMGEGVSVGTRTEVETIYEQVHSEMVKRSA